MKYALGVDVGGTNIRIAVVDENGQMYDVIKESTKARTIEGVKDQIISLVNRIDLSKYQVEGIGIGVPGPVQPDGTVIYIPNLGINESFNLKAMIEKETDNIPNPKARETCIKYLKAIDDGSRDFRF